MLRLQPLDLERLHERAPAIVGAFSHPSRITWIVGAVKREQVSEDRTGFYLTEAQRQLWQL